MRALARFVLAILVVALGWILAADRGLVPGRQAADWVREQVSGPRPPPLPPTQLYDGEALSFDLREPPAEFYGDVREPAPEDDAFVAIAEDANVAYDPALAQAAREYAHIYATQNAMMPGDALAFMLDAAGVVGWGVRQSVMVSNSPDRSVAKDYVRDLIEDGVERIGVGVVDVDGRRVVAALSADASLTLEPVPRAMDLGETLYLDGILPKGFGAPQIVAMRPDLRLVDVEAIEADDAFSAELMMDAEGVWTVEILGLGPFGPAPVTQLTVTVADTPAEQFRSAWPRDETEVRSVAAAESLAAELVADDRRRFHLTSFIRDPELDAIARAHSEDMRENDFVGHQSRRTGGPSDRLTAAEVEVIGLAENVAFNRSLGDAQRGLMRSLGHRRNLLSTDLSHIGFGAATDGESWYITQLFATPMPRLDDFEAAGQEVLAVLNAGRRAAKSPPLSMSAALNSVAQTVAEGVAPTPRVALDAAGRRLHGKASAWVGKMAALTQFEAPPSLFASHFKKVGVAVYQHADSPPPNIHVVLLLSQ